MSWIKKSKTRILEILLILLVFFICLIIIEIGSRYFYNNLRVIPSINEIKIYEDLLKKNHHIRKYVKYNGEKRLSDNYYYSTQIKI